MKPRPAAEIIDQIWAVARRGQWEHPGFGAADSYDVAKRLVDLVEVRSRLLALLLYRGQTMMYVQERQPPIYKAIRFDRFFKPWPDVVQVFDEPGWSAIVPQGQPFVQDNTEVWRVDHGDWILLRDDGSIHDVLGDREFRADYEEVRR